LERELGPFFGSNVLHAAHLFCEKTVVIVDQGGFAVNYLQVSNRVNDYSSAKKLIILGHNTASMSHVFAELTTHPALLHISKARSVATPFTTVR
jgi:hypothetical protein